MHSRRVLIGVLAMLGLAGGCSQFNTNLTNQTSSSFLTFLSPQTVTAGSSDLTLTATGAGFVTGAIVLWNAGPNQIQLATTFVSSSQLTAIVPASDMAAAGNVQVAVQIPGSAVSGASGITATTTTEVSNVVSFRIDPTPGTIPVITSLSASTTSMASTPYCSPTGFTLTVTGSNFDTSSVVNWAGSPRATTFVNSGQLTAVILAQDAAFSGTAGVSVSNSSGPSNTLPFTMTTPTTNLPSPGISSLLPASIKVAFPSPTFTLVVTDAVPGTAFVPCSVVQWNGGPRPTTYVSASQLNATISAADYAAAGTAQVTVVTLPPPASSRTSNAVTFTITP